MAISVLRSFQVAAFPHHSLSGLDTVQGWSKTQSDQENDFLAGRWSTPSALFDGGDPKSRIFFLSVAEFRSDSII